MIIESLENGGQPTKHIFYVLPRCSSVARAKRAVESFLPFIIIKMTEFAIIYVLSFFACACLEPSNTFDVDNSNHLGKSCIIALNVSTRFLDVNLGPFW